MSVAILLQVDGMIMFYITFLLFLAMSKVVKKCRTPNDIFATSDLFEMLSPYARVKDTTWDSEGLKYQKIVGAWVLTE